MKLLRNVNFAAREVIVTKTKTAMRIAQDQILHIRPADDKYDILQNILIDKDYEVVTATSLVSAMQKISESDPALVICNHQVGANSAFSIYNALQPVLTSKEIPFMLYMSRFIKEDVMIGLEIGIDNFIIEPFEAKTLLQKVSRQINRTRKVATLNTDRFNMFFESTPVAKFVTENEKLIKINEAFVRNTGITKKESALPRIDEVFDFTHNENHELDLRKCVMGIKEYCLFKSVPLQKDSALSFDIHMVLSDYFGQNLFTGEIIPVEKNKKINGLSGRKDSDKAQVVLTEREKQVLELSGRGLSIKQIAADLGVSARTVEKHRANIMEKTRTSNIIEAIYYLQE